MSKPFRLVAWNIRAGGGKRAAKIAGALADWRPDAVILSEYRANASGAFLSSILEDIGLAGQTDATGEVASATNAVFIAARSPLRPVPLRRKPDEPGRWRMARMVQPRIALGAMHIPNQHTGRKPGYHSAVLDLARRWRGGPAILAGDTNSGRIGEDEETAVFNKRTHAWFDDLYAAGWRDAFRLKHGAKRDFTWRSPGRGNGFRLDQAFLCPALAERIVEVDHVWASDAAQPGRDDALSDHAALIVDLDVEGL